MTAARTTAVATAKASSGGLGFFGALGLLFIGLKLTHIPPVSDWSWWWVTAPLWAPGALVLVLLFIALVIAFIISLLDA
jgi:hypothetical protein